MTTCSVDFETRSVVDLSAVGVYPYAAHPSTDIWCMAYAFDDEEPEIWHNGEWHDESCPAPLGLACACPGRMPFPARLREHIAAGGELRAWNAQFERVVWRDCARRLHGFPDVRDEQWVCTMVEARAMNLPGKLETAAEVMRLDNKKDMEGGASMQRMARPRKVLPDGTYLWWDLPDRRERLYSYCKQDVRVEREAAKCLRRLVPSERSLYLLDQRINDRGILVDVPLAEAMVDIVRLELERVNAEVTRLTAGTVGGVTKVAQLKEWMLLNGVIAESLDKDNTAAFLADPSLPDDVRRVVELRAEAGRSSVAKLGKILGARGSDDCIRGMLRFLGAGTGRWSGAIVQPQNFARPSLEHPEWFIPHVLNRDIEALSVFASPLEVVMSLLRGTLRARPGHRLVSADYAGIEARLTNWLAGQHDIVEMFRAGTDIYMHGAIKMFGLPADASKKQYPQERQAGKAVELGCGFGMGWEKFRTTAAKAPYFLTLTEEEARRYVAFYRDSHPAVVDYWNTLNAAVLEAVRTPGATFSVGAGAKVKITKRGSYLFIILPSGRPLCYPRPRIVERPVPWDVTQTRPSVRVEGIDSLTKQWTAYDLYGGLLCENIVQAVARDIMAEGMVRVDSAGYPVILTVHDEIVTDTPLGYGSVEEFVRLLEVLPAWAPGCPITAEGSEGERYGK